MDELEKLRKEIERRLEELNPKKGTFMGKPLRDVNPKTFPRESELEKLLSFIDSMQKEHVSENLEEAAEDYGIGQGVELKPFAIKYFKAGANWQKEQMMKDAVELPLYLDGDFLTVDYDFTKSGYKVGDKVKMIIIKED